LDENKPVSPEKKPPEAGVGASPGAGTEDAGAPAIGTFAGEGAAGTLLGEDMFLRMKIFGMNQ
jgi:hypothetical protein